MTVLHFERGFMYTLNRTFLVIIKCSLSYYTVLHYFEFIVVLKNQYKQTKNPHSVIYILLILRCFFLHRQYICYEI